MEMTHNRNIDFPARERFMKEVEDWRTEEGISQREVLRRINVLSMASYSLWMRPDDVGFVLISPRTMARLTKLTGIQFNGSNEIENDKYNAQLKKLKVLV